MDLLRTTRDRALGLRAKGMLFPARRLSRTISIVINTCDRRDSLARTIESLSAQIYRDFEIVVIDGPSTDGTRALLLSFGARVKVGSCPKRCLGLSRNLGIDLAAGEIVAFLDDDAVPGADWLEKLAAAYDQPDVAAAGGYVFDVPFGRVAYRICSSTRSGDATTDAPGPVGRYLGRGADPFLYLAGCNMSFRRSALVAVGGFNEALVYGYDDVDICARIIDAGWKITVIEDAIVKHHRAANAVRDSTHAIRDVYPLIHARAVFALQGLEAGDRREVVLAQFGAFATSWHGTAETMRDRGDLTTQACDQFRKRIDEGVRDGIEAAKRPRVIRGFADRAPSFRPVAAR